MVRPSADLFLEEEDLPAFAANQWLHVCSIALSAEPSRSTTFAAMEKIKVAGGRVSFDPNIRRISGRIRSCCTPVSTAPCVWRTW
jgi:fructokinase